MKTGIIINDYGTLIRAEKDANSPIVGYLNIFDVVDILETTFNWTKIQHNEVIGYVKTKHLINRR